MAVAGSPKAKFLHEVILVRTYREPEARGAILKPQPASAKAVANELAHVRARLAKHYPRQMRELDVGKSRVLFH